MSPIPTGHGPHGAGTYGSPVPLSDAQLLDELSTRGDRFPDLVALAGGCPHCGTIAGHECTTPTGRSAPIHTARRP